MKFALSEKTIIVVAIATLLVLMIPVISWIHDAKFRGYIQTDVEELSDKPVLGIDVSHYQGVINWREVGRSGLDFVFIKATGGETFVDPEFVKNWHGARTADLSRGAYHFFLASDDATKQAENFLKAVGKLRDTDLPPMLDIEITDGRSHHIVEQGALQWLKIVEKALGRKPVVYTGSYFGKTVLTDPEFSRYPLWVADYGPKIEAIPGPWKSQGWTIWQYSQKGQITGIKGHVDLDKFHADFRAFEHFISSSKITTAPNATASDATQTQQSNLPADNNDSLQNQKQGSVE